MDLLVTSTPTTDGGRGWFEKKPKNGLNELDDDAKENAGCHPVDCTSNGGSSSDWRHMGHAGDSGQAAKRRLRQLPEAMKKSVKH